MTYLVRLPSPVRPAASVSDLRTAVSGLALQAIEAVQTVRQAFVAGVAPLPTAGSGSVSSYLAQFGGQGMAGNIVRSTSRLGLSTATARSTVGAPRPELDQVDVLSDRSVGILDSFYCRVVASVATKDLPKVSAIRLMRTRAQSLDVVPPTVSALQQVPYGQTLQADPIGAAADRMAQLGAGNKLSLFVRNDGYSTSRSVVSSASLRPVPAPVNTNRIGTSAGLLSVSNADPSVLESLSFLMVQRTQTAVTASTIPLTVGQRQGINVLGGGSVSASPQIPVVSGNLMGFREIARLPPSPDHTVGDYAEFEFTDATVMYGNSYTYYVSCLGGGGIEGPRSRLVKAEIVRMIPPAAPVVKYTVTAGLPRFSIRCTGTFVDHVEVYRKGGQRPTSVRVMGTDSSMVVDRAPVFTVSGYSHVGDLTAGSDRSVTFVDRSVLPGQTADYRFYSVDAYGAKSQTPFSCSVVIPDPSRFIPLGIPTITVEQASSPPMAVAVSVSCDDPRVVSFVVMRREALTEDGFHNPTEPDKVRLGWTDPKRGKSRCGPILQGTQKVWSGILSAVSGAAAMVDTAVGFDRPYQYSVYGVDLRGNLTSQVPSQYIAVSPKPVSASPVALTATINVDGSGAPTGVLIGWSAGTSDFAPADLIGDQDVLAATSVRSVYQVERRSVGSPNWDPLPVCTGSSFLDPVSPDVSPTFRTSYAQIGEEYQYRVLAMQTGGFLSTYTDPIWVTVGPSLVPPSPVWVRSTPLAVRPAQVVVSWNYGGNLIDRWQVERASTNKVYGSKIVSMESSDAQSLAYQRVAEIPFEASQAMGVGQTFRANNPTVFVGNRFYMDQDVDLANSYFYRVRSVDLAGNVTDWTYAGISLTDSPHDRKFYSTLSDGEKVMLTRDPRPIASWRPA